MGYVYIVSNAAMPGLVKIGSTDRTVAERLLELSSPTGVPAAFRLEFSAACHDQAVGEARVHAALSRDRVTSAREFFRVPVEYAKYVLIEALQAQMVESMTGWSDDDVARLSDRIRNRRLGTSRRCLAEVLSWTDDELMQLVDQIFSSRPKVHLQFR